MLARVAAPHHLHELVHRPRQADPRDERGPAQQEDREETDDAPERDVPVAG